MANNGTVLVVGATGNVGSVLIPGLRSAGVSVRALVRDEAKVQPLRAQGVDVVLGDLDQPDTLDEAFSGVEKVYLVTWNGPTGGGHGHNIIEAAKRTSRPHIVNQGGHGSPKSRIIKDHILLEQELKDSGLAYTNVQPTFFMQNLMMAGQTVASDGAIYLPMKQGRIGMIDVRDIAAAAQAVLRGSGHEGKSYVLTGPRSISVNDVAAALTEALGKPVHYFDVPPEAAKQFMVGMGVPEWIADGFSELFEEFAINWGDHVSPSVEQLTGRPAISIEQFARDFAGAFGGALAPAGAR